MEENKRISELFDRARTQAPQASYADVKRTFLAASAAGGVGIIAKWAGTTFKFKLIFMITTLSTLTIGGILIATQLTGNPKATDMKPDVAHPKPTTNIEVRHENGVQETTIYDENDRIVKVLVDSSEHRLRSLRLHFDKLNVSRSVSAVGSVADKLDNRGEVTAIAPNQPKTIKNGTIPSETVRETPKKRNAAANVQDSSMKVFEITQRTTTQELELIQKQATEAGIDFNYTARVKKDIVKRISMNMKINDGNSTWNSEISGTNSFRFTFGWWEDESGKVRRFLTDKEADIGAYRANP